MNRIRCGDTRVTSITIHDPLTLKRALAFPVQSSVARRDLAIGAALLLVPVVGWLLNMGHRIRFVHNMQHGRDPFPAWHAPYVCGRDSLLRHGFVTFAGMVLYHSPASLCIAIATFAGERRLFIIAVPFWLVATAIIPGYMTAYCRAFDAREVFDPRRAIRRVAEAHPAYWHAWAIALTALAGSFLGLTAFIIGFLITSVWFWQTAGFAFASVFTQTQRTIDTQRSQHSSHESNPT